MHFCDACGRVFPLFSPKKMVQSQTALCMTCKYLHDIFWRQIVEVSSYVTKEFGMK